MSPEERQLLTGLFDRIRGAANAPRDQEADALIQDATKAQPYAPYFLAQTVLVQDQALRAANDRLQELEGKVKDLEGQAANAPRSGGFLGGLGSLFGGGRFGSANSRLMISSRSRAALRMRCTSGSFVAVPGRIATSSANPMIVLSGVRSF